MSAPSKPFGEDAFVEKYLKGLTNDDPAALRLEDDAALLKPAKNHTFVMTCDTLIAGTHFLFDETADRAFDAAHKALAVNVSDLVAKGATPRAYLLSLALPSGDFHTWMPAFVRALEGAQKAWGLSLIGGDTVRSQSELAITITAIGEVPDKKMVARHKAKPGDIVYVSGTIGDATLGLSLCLKKPQAINWAQIIGNDGCQSLVKKHRQPTPSVKLAPILRAHAHAAIDISDGFVRDLNRLCAASDSGANIDANLVPISKHARQLVSASQAQLQELLTGGDDYEIIACIPANEQQAFESALADIAQTMTKVGTLTEGGDVRITKPDGQPMSFKTTGWDHLE